MSSNLIIRLRAGDDSCFKQIYDLYHFKVFCFVKKYTSQLADSEDVTQNVFIHLWKYRTKLDPEVSLEAVLFKSSKQEISRWYKKQNRIFSVEDDKLIKELDSKTQSEEEVSLQMEKIEYLLDKIPAKRRKIFSLHKFEDRSYKEIAEEMDMSPGAVANQISKTLQFLKKNSVNNHELYWFALFFLYQTELVS
ncbi:RNA polymerase sigma factor [Flavobacterium johnsoniae]|uniref:ECF subfamily RNA polymerase sigma-24 subunit n=1 Tax=Flavobacterium johnsoniae (strain ATCC 17061 / DSM 2064 / JCM 8514 / BCRC 14874 / CCUG 350202 / NBRC 14942 / NCIMB 11054 / UW101) TaxID=376686 RepID=A5FD42_FLAJ1|nr:sigma-70 family RNA polymerase sigma factor [Flavobacterium johnsoniae]ABQ06870.1 ECF subfamily RNA polymerase sigma-24 subunit [Flavobacterium johnsoniae UW101]OXE97270.1 RNA polymerase subunit sigma-24 [Flavobacterium johnsoniae UW101]WQG81296.1 sigma-70 family RNA polymerase sigma factor [Flavobacterium johnsoniae UW101]SHL38182.1 RNA polymerase sigma-70 factor, ECF subfamily [Flavobacterium johnsoniae]